MVNNENGGVQGMLSSLRGARNCAWSSAVTARRDPDRSESLRRVSAALAMLVSERSTLVGIGTCEDARRTPSRLQACIAVVP